MPFFCISGSEFVEMFVGVGASRVRDLFDQAKRNAPCIVFVDEIDAVGRQRGAGLGGSHDEREQTLNQILVEMDGFDTNTNVIVIAATNRPDVLDPALLRPGRFDRQVVLDRAGHQGPQGDPGRARQGQAARQGRSIWTSWPSRRPASPAPTWPTWSTRRAILAARRNKKTIGMAELEEAIDRVIAGPERKSRVISEQREARSRPTTRAATPWSAQDAPQPRPGAQDHDHRARHDGRLHPLPADRRPLPLTKRQFEDRHRSAPLGGHAAEELVFGEITTGAEQRHREGHRHRPPDGHASTA